MTPEEYKDLRLMLEMLTKDLKRLGDDLKYLAQYMEPLVKKEEE